MGNGTGWRSGRSQQGDPSLGRSRGRRTAATVAAIASMAPVVFGVATSLAVAPVGEAAASGEPVAPAGPCAEARRLAIVPDPDPDYSVAGPPAARFSATDVASPLAASAPLAPPPSAALPLFRGVGPCEVSRSGCSPTSAPLAPSAAGVFPYVPPPGPGRP